MAAGAGASRVSTARVGSFRTRRLGADSPLWKVGAKLLRDQLRLLHGLGERANGRDPSL